jgi:hypothetical protein
VQPHPTRIPRSAGWLLVAPAAVLFLLSYVIPTFDYFPAGRLDEIWEFATSGFFGRALWFAVSFALLPILILASVAPAFAWAASRAGLAGRWVARAALALPLAAFAPTGFAIVWLSRHGPDNLADTSVSMLDTRLIALATMGGFGFAVAVTCYLSALRRPGAGARTWPAVLVVGVVLALVMLGVAVQQYPMAEIFNGSAFLGEPEVTPMTLLATSGTNGPVGAAVVAVLAVLGAAAALVILRSGLRIELDPAVRSPDGGAGPPAGRRAVALIGTAAGVIGLLGFIVIQLGPWLSGVALGDPEPPDGFTAGSVLAATWLVPLGTALIQVGAAAVAGFGIAVVRPLGRHSEWLLLVFAPWLLVGNGLLEATHVDFTSQDGLQPLIAYSPPSWLSIPALFVFVLLFRGQAAVWERLRAGGDRYAFPRAMWPALPMLVLATGVAWLLQAQDLLVPVLADHDQGVVPNAQLLVRRSATIPVGVDADVAALGYPLALLVLFTLGALVLQWAYLDRVAIRTGRPAAPAPPPWAYPGQRWRDGPT